MAKRVDWSFIRPLYEAGGLSNVEISLQYNDVHREQDEFKPTVSEAAIRKQAKEKRWKKTLADRIKKAAREKLVRGEFEAPSGSNQDEIDEATVRAASDSMVQVLKLHRKDIDQLKVLEKDLVRRLSEDEDQVVIGWFQGEASEHIIKLGLDQRARVYHRLVGAIGRRIQLERLAWGIDDKDKDNDLADRIEVNQEF